MKRCSELLALVLVFLCSDLGFTAPSPATSSTVAYLYHTRLARVFLF
nr:hypothetical protein [Providencia rettgeri]